MELGVTARCVVQVRFPLGVVEGPVQVSVGVDDGAGGVVVELDPKAVEPDGFDEGQHGLVLRSQGALGSASDDIVSAGDLDQGSQCLDHGLVAFESGCQGGKHED